MAFRSFPASQARGFLAANTRGRKDHINVKILHSGSMARDEGYSRNHGLQDPDDYVVVWAPKGYPLDAAFGVHGCTIAMINQCLSDLGSKGVQPNHSRTPTPKYEE